MTVTAFVIFDRNGFVNATKTEGFTLKPGQLVARVDLEIGDDVFDTPPIPVIQITIPNDALTRRFEATVKTEEPNENE